jgi:hypothetical protein
MRRPLPIRRQLVFGLQVVVGVNVQVGLQSFCGVLFTGQFEAKRGDFAGAKVVIAP